MEEMRTALRTLPFLPPSWGRLSRPLRDISLIWPTQDRRLMGKAASHRAPPVPPQLAPRARPPSVPPPLATLTAALPPWLLQSLGKGDGGTTVGTVVTVASESLRFLLHLLPPSLPTLPAGPPALQHHQRVWAPGVRRSASHLSLW